MKYVAVPHYAIDPCIHYIPEQEGLSLRENVEYALVLAIKNAACQRRSYSYAGKISMISSDSTAAAISASQSSLDSDSRILSSLGLVAGCFGRNTVQQSS